MALGGFIIQKFHLKLMGILKMCLGFILAGAILGGGCFFIHCPQERFAGINSDYGLAVYVVKPLMASSVVLGCQSSAHALCPLYTYARTTQTQTQTHTHTYIPLIYTPQKHTHSQPA